MKKILHHIRKQPEHVKTRYVIVFAITATAFVIMFWLITLQIIKRTDDTIQTESPFAIVKQVFKGSVSDMKNAMPQKQESLDETLGGVMPAEVPPEIDSSNGEKTIDPTVKSLDTDTAIQPVDVLPTPVQ